MEGGVNSEIRNLGIDEALGLRPGSDHYRAYVGPPDRYDFIGASQFALLFAFGLCERDRVLDVGCGSLRLGRMLIPFLRRDRYFGVEPHQWLIDDGISRELGADAIALKNPTFSNIDDFDFSTLNSSFDFIIAQSIATHCGPDLIEKMFDGTAKSLAEDGIFLFSYRRGDNPRPAEDGWVYPKNIPYDEEWICDMLASAGLIARAIPWYHPGANWICAAKHDYRLPEAENAAMLHGRPLSRAD